MYDELRPASFFRQAKVHVGRQKILATSVVDRCFLYSWETYEIDLRTEAASYFIKHPTKSTN